MNYIWNSKTPFFKEESSFFSQYPFYFLFLFFSFSPLTSFFPLTFNMYIQYQPCPPPFLIHYLDLQQHCFLVFYPQLNLARRERPEGGSWELEKNIREVRKVYAKSFPSFAIDLLTKSCFVFRSAHVTYIPPSFAPPFLLFIHVIHCNPFGAYQAFTREAQAQRFTMIYESIERTEEISFQPPPPPPSLT